MAKRLAKTRKRLLNKATTEISLQHGRNVPPAYAYQELSNVGMCYTYILHTTNLNIIQIIL